MPPVTPPVTGRVSQGWDQSPTDHRVCTHPRSAAYSLCARTSECLRKAFLTWRDHLQLSAAADCLASTVGAARVGALIPGLQVVDQQRAIWGLVDTVAIGLYWQPIPGGERKQSCLGPLVFKPQSEEAMKDHSRASCFLCVDKQMTLTSRKMEHYQSKITQKRGDLTLSTVI